MKQTGVYLGRFSPFQKGHQKVLDAMIETLGVDNILVIIGSINTRNSRTPYTYNQREEMIKKLYPDIAVMGLPDGKPGLVYFDGTTNEKWLDSIEKIQNDLGVKFVFYGGSKEDLEILSQRFPTKIIVDRNFSPEFTATNVRNALATNDMKKLNELLDPTIVPLAVAGYEDFINTQK